MNAVFRAYAPLFHQMLGDRGGRRTLLWVSGVLVVVAVVGAWLSLAVKHSSDGAGAFCCVALALFLWLWSSVFVSTAMLQNHPANACLVPHLRRRLITACVAMFVVSSVVLAVAVSLFFGHFGYAVAGAGLLVPYVLLAQRFVYLAMLPVYASPLSQLVPAAWTDRLTALLASINEPTLSLFGVAADIALLAWGISIALPRGGDRHFALNARRTLWRTAGTDGAALRELQRRRVWRWGYARVLRRDSVRAGAPGHKLMHTMGTTVNEGSTVFGVVVCTLLAVLAALANVPDVKIFGPIAIFDLAQVFMLLSVSSYTVAVLLAAVTHNAEQGLYRLAPGAPSARELNRVFAKAIVLRFLKIWLVVLAGLVAIDCARRGSLELRAYPLALASLTLPFICFLLPDYARLRAAPRWGVSFGFLVALILGYLFFAALAASPGFPWLVLVCPIVAGSLLTLWVRWISMTRMPPAFPAGRLAA
ncbi:hypothetical protein NHH73_13945 [Oxalobacteraceae bacterium OTU3CINTB1]|nr:hypothetical protein NHH73_13945 [Oxalobacteraceae bacterium OTU3CINTB1]